MRGVLALAISLAACGGSAPHEEEDVPAQASAGSEGTTDPTDDDATDRDMTTDAPAIAFGNDAVRARLAALEGAPAGLELRVLDLTPSQALGVCAYLDEQSADHAELRARCENGESVVFESTCNPANLASAAETLGAACPVRVGEYVACELAVRADPCTVGFLRASAPECEAVNACLLAASGGGAQAVDR